MNPLIFIFSIIFIYSYSIIEIIGWEFVGISLKSLLELVKL
jgi:hypothetical protein